MSHRLDYRLTIEKRRDGDLDTLTTNAEISISSTGGLHEASYVQE